MGFVRSICQSLIINEVILAFAINMPFCDGCHCREVKTIVNVWTVEWDKKCGHCGEANIIVGLAVIVLTSMKDL